MSNRFCTLWSVKTALNQSAALIRAGSHLRIAGLAVREEGVGKIEKISVDSEKCACAGQGKIINGFLIGAPVS
jgi:hypothetical protein